MTTSSENLDKTVDLSSLQPGSLVDVETKSRHYSIECVNGETLISGHPKYCPDPVAVHLQGTIDSAGNLELGFIEPGNRLMFFLDDHPVITSKVLHVHVEQPKPN